jgi:hypothetical protein
MATIIKDKKLIELFEQEEKNIPKIDVSNKNEITDKDK